MLQRYPRVNLAEEFEDQAQHKPDSSAAAAIGDDLAARMARNPLQRPE